MSKFFETIRIEDGQVCNIKWHQKRYERTVSHFGGKKLFLLAELIDAPDDKGLFRCKLIYTPKEIVDINYFPYKKRSISSLRLVEADDIDYSYKYFDRSGLDALFAKREECDEVLIVKKGLICDTTIANVAFFDGREWITPASPLLEGTTRARYIEEKKIVPKEITPRMLGSFTKIALLNAMIDFDIMSIKEIQKDRIIC